MWSRWRIYRRILLRPAWSWLLIAPFGPLSLLGAFQAIRDEFLEDQWQRRLAIPQYLENIPWWIWVLVASLIAVIIILESAYRTIRELGERYAIDKEPVLEISGPYWRLSKVDTNEMPLWYVIVRNKTEGSVARNVSICMDYPDPGINPPSPITLHRLHDNTKPFMKTHDIRYGDSAPFDVFACGQYDPEMYYFYRADGDEERQVGPEWMLDNISNEIISAMAHSEYGWRFRVLATPDPPAKPSFKCFCVRWNADASLPNLEELKKSQD